LNVRDHEFENCSSSAQKSLHFSLMPKSQRRFLADKGPPSARRSIFFSAIGEVVEWFDFMVYLSLAPILARVFFPGDSKSSLLITLGIFASGFLARPIGALLFGQFGDRVGRKRALMASALLMAVAKLIEGLLPTYATIGFLAPAIFVIARIISGISLGGEYTGTFVMLFESAPAGRRGLITSLANVMGGTGVFLASSLVALLIASLSKESMETWGWRVPFFTGSLIALIALAIRTKVSETPLFEELRSKGGTLPSPLRESVRRQPGAILTTFAMAAFNALSYYLVVAFVPTYLESFVKVDHATAMLVATVASAFNVVFIAIPGWISDFFGRKPVLLAGCLGFLFLGYPLYVLLASGALVSMLIAALAFVMLCACFMGAAMTAAMEHFSTEVRFSGFALGYNIGAGLLGGSTPLVAGWLIHSTSVLTAPSFYLMAASAVLLIVCSRLKETFRSNPE
jgi:MFS transporter, MHS family, proline/betaine transporter